jgi:hypothetical protein
MNRYTSILVVAIFVILSSDAAGDTTRRDSGMLFGADHAFYFTASEGWILDNKSGVPQGLHMIFYPKGFTWANSPVIAYGRSVTKNNIIRTIEDQVKLTVEEFHRNGSPDYKYKVGEKIKLNDDRFVYLYTFSGDQWGNYEAVGYVEEERTINFLVFNARKLKDYEKFLPGFKSILVTYRNVYSKDINDDAFLRLVKEANHLIDTEDGKTYEGEVIKLLGPSLANIMRDCSSYTSKPNNVNFELVFRIDKSGKVVETYARPSNALTTCVKGMILPLTYIPHNFNTFVQHIDMKIND